MKKFYGFNITTVVMDEFKGSCKELGLSLGTELERILCVYNNNKLAYLDKSKLTKEQISGQAQELQDVVNKIKESLEDDK